MKVTTDGNVFTLRVECEQDQRLLDALHMQRHVAIGGFVREALPGCPGISTHVGALLEVNAQSESALRAQAGRECLSALGKLFSLGLREAARHGHVGTDAAEQDDKAGA